MKQWKFFLKLFISILILWYLTTSTPLHEVKTALLQSDLTLILSALLCVLISLFLMAVRISSLMKQQRFTISLKDIFYIRLSSFYYKLFIPGGTVANIGILFYKFSKIRKDKKAEIIATIMVDRILATLGLSLIGIISLLFSKPNLPPIITYILITIFLVSIFFILILLNKMFYNLFERFVINNTRGKISDIFLKLLNSIKYFQNLSKIDFIYHFLLSLAPHVFGVLAFTAISHSIGISLNIFDWGWMRSVIIFGTMLPISIAGLGVRDGILIYLLQQYSISTEVAWAMSFIVLAVTVLWPGILGLLAESRCTDKIVQ